MKSRELLLAVADFLRAELSTTLFPDPDGSELAPRVFLHNVPESPDSGSYPFVILRLGAVENTETAAGCEAEDTVLMALGVWSEDGPEAVGLMGATLMDIIRAALMRQRQVAEKFDLVLPLTGASPEPDRQWNQYHMATIVTRWNYPTPRRPLSPSAN